MGFDVEGEGLEFLATHIFCPPRLPQKNDQSRVNDRLLCEFVCYAASRYEHYNEKIIKTIQWSVVRKMLQSLREAEQHDSISLGMVAEQLSSMSTRDVLVYLVRAQNAAIVARKREGETVFESFEVSPASAEVLKTVGKLVCTYPGPAIVVDDSIVRNTGFLHELSSFISQMRDEELDSQAVTYKAGSKVAEPRETASPHYITEFLTGVLRGVGRPADVRRITKRINDDVLWKDAYLPWRRSSVWLVIRVALQTTLGEADDHTDYKFFMLFLMSSLLRLTARGDFHGDFLHAFRAKLATRYYKLGDSVPAPITTHVLKSLRMVHNILESRFQIIQKNHAASPRWAPMELDVKADRRLTLANSRTYILERFAARPTPRPATSFSPTSPPRVRDTHACSFDAFDVEALERAFKNKEGVYIALADFETLVKKHVNHWGSSSPNSDEYCRKLGRCIQVYIAAAEPAYKGNAEDNSLMFLTAFELWVALDKAVTEKFPLLLEYSPEVPVEALHHLLLRQSSSLRRLSKIEQHLSSRHEHASCGSVFDRGTSASSFAVRSASQSEEMQSLKCQIERDATSARDQVKQELQMKNSRSKDLVNRASGLEHCCHVRGGRTVPLPGYLTCDKCDLTREVNTLSINLHEWPLPSDDYAAQAVVFELRCPVPFQVWRCVTYFMLHDVCTADTSSQYASQEMILGHYKPLELYRNANKDHFSRIGFASSTKSFLRAHYGRLTIPNTESNICVNNGLRWELHDSARHKWTRGFTGACERLKQLCSLQLPTEGPYMELTFALANTTHTPNDVLAKQSDCSPELSLHEWTAFGLLRSGGRIQWLNVLRELRARALSFGREEVHILLTQALWQAGPLDSEGKREWHAQAEDQHFALGILLELDDLLTSVEANWADSVVVKTIILITSRIASALADSTEDACKLKICKLLRRTQYITLRWIRSISAGFDNVLSASELLSLKLRICELAAICRSTFDLDEIYLSEMLANVADVTVLLECAVLIHDNTPSLQSDIPQHLLRLLARNRRLSHRLQPLLYDSLQQQSLTTAMKSLFGDFDTTSSWQRLRSPVDQWLRCNCVHSVIHLDILTGELLINGKPVSRLPAAILNHPTYVRLFSKFMLDVVPSDIPGMDFATRSPFAGHTIHFAMKSKTSDLIIVSKSGQRAYELIPHTKLSSDVPDLLVTKYVHWMRRDPVEPVCACVEFRPLDNPWLISDNNWLLKVTPSDAYMSQGQSFLIDCKSPTFSMIAQQLRALEHPRYLTAMSSPDHVIIDLPRYDLAFKFVPQSHEPLQSCNWGDLVVDSDQSSGTMFGLSSQLLMVNRTCSPPERHLLIPIGDVEFIKHGHHVSVHIDTLADVRVRYHKYRVDAVLGRLHGNGTLHSKLHQIYLHALTSYCLPDPLTQRTGTEEAILELQSARCFSFQKLEPECVSLLENISRLSPKQMHYPEHLKVMQTVLWSDLGFMSQNPKFHELAEAILHHAKYLVNIFVNRNDRKCISDALETLAEAKADTQLVHRSILRWEKSYNQIISGPSPLNTADNEYIGRCSPSHGTREQAVASVASLIYRRPSRLPICETLLDEILSWDSNISPARDMTLTYSSKWFIPDLPGIWLSFCNWCRSLSDPHEFWSAMIFPCSAMLYRADNKHIHQLIGTLLALAAHRHLEGFENSPVPTAPSKTFEIRRGCKIEESKLLDLVKSAAVPFDYAACAELSQDSPKDKEKALQQHVRRHEKICMADADRVVAHLRQQWPRSHPVLPQVAHIKTEDIEKEVQYLFRSWNDNRILSQHVKCLQDVLISVLRRGLPVVKQYTIPSAPTQASLDLMTRAVSRISADNLFTRVAPELDRELSVWIPPTALAECPPHSGEHDKLNELIRDFTEQSTSRFKRQYGRRLRESYDALLSKHASNSVEPPDLETYHHNAENSHRTILRAMLLSLSCQSVAEKVLENGGVWPRLSIRDMLGRLASVSPGRSSLSIEWTRCLLLLSQSTMQLQHSRRLLVLRDSRRPEQLFNEIQSSILPDSDSDDKDNMEQIGDWALVQIDSDFLMRPRQVDIAHEMMAPSSNNSSVLQLNMGEGKSAVIVPLVAAALADTSKLVRVVVLKALSTQMFHLLVDRLSGLAGRRVFYLPFSRDVRVTLDTALQIKKLLGLCAGSRGILVAQPEHILSLKLMSVDLSDSSRAHTLPIAQSLLELQAWLDRVSRDILDESDEMLNVGYQLVYTAGSQRPVDDHPDRWRTVQEVFDSLTQLVSNIRDRHPEGIELAEHGGGTFPYVRVLREEAWTDLARKLARRVLARDTTLRHLPSNVSRAARNFIMHREKANSEGVNLLQEHCQGKSTWKKLLLLRGLIGHGILGYVLKEKRWRVDYGLDLKRTLLAVPYSAKDVPSLRADFGHPDVAISHASSF